MGLAACIPSLAFSPSHPDTCTNFLSLFLLFSLLPLFWLARFASPVPQASFYLYKTQIWDIQLHLVVHRHRYCFLKSMNFLLRPPGFRILSLLPSICFHKANILSTDPKKGGCLLHGVMTLNLKGQGGKRGTWICSMKKIIAYYLNECKSHGQAQSLEHYCINERQSSNLIELLSGWELTLVGDQRNQDLSPSFPSYSYGILSKKMCTLQASVC